MNERDHMECADGPLRDEAVEVQAVTQFSMEMRSKLRKNAHKVHWSEHADAYLFYRLVEEVGELAEALLGPEGGDSAAVISECSDVGNIVMMLADNRRKREVPSG
jgi:NTP pyrophosphatase (non-canonical NTP hydrolase)